jgi:hypothetical protein
MDLKKKTKATKNVLQQLKHICEKLLKAYNKSPLTTKGCLEKKLKQHIEHRNQRLHKQENSFAA